MSCKRNSSLTDELILMKLNWWTDTDKTEENNYFQAFSVVQDGSVPFVIWLTFLVFNCTALKWTTGLALALSRLLLSSFISWSFYRFCLHTLTYLHYFFKQYSWLYCIRTLTRLLMKSHGPMHCTICYMCIQCTHVLCSVFITWQSNPPTSQKVCNH